MATIEMDSSSIMAATAPTFATTTGAIGSNFYNTSHEIGRDDVLHITDLSLESFLDNLRIRYQNGIYYTYIGEVCVSVNPNRPNMGIYGTDYMQMYYGKRLRQMPPHIFAIAGSAYQETFEKNRDSCVVITGESGSGKTEASKLLHLFIAHIVKTREIGQAIQSETPQNIAKIESILLSSNCILEAFGNARTLRNLNSSRFGKYTEICFSRSRNVVNSFKDSGSLTTPAAGVGEQHFYALIHSYMLEKSRVIEQQTGERNFHAFYHLLSSLEPIDNDDKASSALRRDSLGLIADASVYKYLNSNECSVVTEQDCIDFKQVLQAMQTVGFSHNEQITVFHTLAAILHLGNVEFEQIETEEGDSKLVSTDYLQHIVPTTMGHLEQFCRLLSLELSSTLETLCGRKIRTRREIMYKSYRQTDAVNGRNALAKALYERVFYFILGIINRPLQDSKPKVRSALVTNTIGILDIYGFEVFNNQPNAFEQFMVNYCNEKLHQLFVDVILHKEQELYSREDIDWQLVEFDNNLHICLLMDEPHRGIFAVLDEACTSGQSNTDEAILCEFNRRFAQHDHYKSRALNPALRQLRPQTDFIVRHYAGDVHYTIEGFMEKNLDQLYVDYKQLLYSSDNSLIHDMWQDGKQTSLTSLVHRLPPTASFEFRRSMCELIDRLTPKRQFFVRCIKPNEDLNMVDEFADKFNDAKVRHQIQYLGLVENARVSKAGFVSRIPYQEFLQRFRMLYDACGDKFDWSSLNMSNYNSKQSQSTVDLRPVYLNVCKQIIADNCSDIDGSPSKEKNKLAFGKTMLFFREHSTIECLEQRRFQYLDKLIFQLQTYGRSVLAKRRFARMKLAQQIICQFARYKKYEFFEELFAKLHNYRVELSALFRGTPPSLLEYYQVDMFEWPAHLQALQSQHNDRLLLRDLPELVAEFNKWAIILKFPQAYWKDKLLRLDACKLFWGAKADWGETRGRWIGDYLTSQSEGMQYARFKKLFRRYFGEAEILFSSYMLKTNAYNLEHVRGLVMTETGLFKVNIDEMKAKTLTLIPDIVAVSMSPDADQLVVLHLNDTQSSDIVFSFYSLTSSVNTAQGQGTALSQNTKVGEFVTLLTQQYKKLCKSDLKVYFDKHISFKFANEPLTIEVKTSGQAAEQLYPDYMSRLKHIFTLKRFRELYLRIKPFGLMSTRRGLSEQELLKKRVEFEKISKNNFVLIYNVH